jgi:hypothetical protein
MLMARLWQEAKHKEPADLSSHGAIIGSVFRILKAIPIQHFYDLVQFTDELTCHQ